MVWVKITSSLRLGNLPRHGYNKTTWLRFENDHSHGICGSRCDGVELMGALGLALSQTQGSSGTVTGAGTEAMAGAAAGRVEAGKGSSDSQLLSTGGGDSCRAVDDSVQVPLSLLDFAEIFHRKYSH